MSETPLATTHFVRKPFYVDGIRVTKENMEEVANWCKGLLKETAPKIQGKKPSPFIEVDVHRPANERQRRAFVGDWVLQAENGFKVYTDTALKQTFEVASADAVMQKLRQKLEG